MNEREQFEVEFGGALDMGRAPWNADAYGAYSTDVAWAAWQARAALAASPVPATLSDERIDHIADIVTRGMPDGIRGFCKTWGWQQFARELLRACAGYVASPVPAGYKLVPVEPTPEMMDAAEACNDDWPRTTWRAAWTAMLAAAPSAPAQPATEQQAELLKDGKVVPTNRYALATPPQEPQALAQAGGKCQCPPGICLGYEDDVCSMPEPAQASSVEAQADDLRLLERAYYELQMQGVAIDSTTDEGKLLLEIAARLGKEHSNG
jgi:hypothetical protein